MKTWHIIAGALGLGGLAMALGGGGGSSSKKPLVVVGKPMSQGGNAPSQGDAPSKVESGEESDEFTFRGDDHWSGDGLWRDFDLPLVDLDPSATGALEVVVRLRHFGPSNEYCSVRAFEVIVTNGQISSDEAEQQSQPCPPGTKELIPAQLVLGQFEARQSGRTILLHVQGYSPGDSAKVIIDASWTFERL